MIFSLCGRISASGDVLLSKQSFCQKSCMKLTNKKKFILAAVKTELTFI